MQKKSVKRKRGKKKLGLALGSGSARGFVHIGVLKVLHEHKIYPAYVTGCSIGSVIGSSYCAGVAPLEIEEIALDTNWQNMIDFNVPLFGLVKGKKAEDMLKQMTRGKSFHELQVPFKTVAYNISKKRKEVFSKGKVAKAVRASMAMPGVFNPAKIGKDYYIDGGVVDPNPVDLLKDMGADVIISVDLYDKDMSKRKKNVKDKDFLASLKERFLAEELLLIDNYLDLNRWPGFFKKVVVLVIRKLSLPARIVRMMAGKELPMIAKVMFESQAVMFAELSKIKSDNSQANVRIVPHFKDLRWYDLNKIDKFIKLGEEEARKKIPEIKRLLR